MNTKAYRCPLGHVFIDRFYFISPGKKYVLKWILCRECTKHFSSVKGIYSEINYYRDNPVNNNGDIEVLCILKENYHEQT